jgi:hypothetical protein
MEKKFEDALNTILFSFYKKLDAIAYNRYEITAADILDLGEAYNRKVVLRSRLKYFKNQYDVYASFKSLLLI